MILVIDNYDSFTYNLVQLIAQFVDEVKVIRNDQISVEEIRALRPSGILISPGPGRPEDAGICTELIRALGHETPLLGVCLGHQVIGHAFGARITHAPRLMHGKTSLITHEKTGIFQETSNPFQATRYHSLVIDEKSIPKELAVTARSEDGTIMGVRHRAFPIEGIQFHPESILTDAGPGIIRSWVTQTMEVV